MSQFVVMFVGSFLSKRTCMYTNNMVIPKVLTQYIDDAYIWDNLENAEKIADFWTEKITKENAEIDRQYVVVSAEIVDNKKRNDKVPLEIKKKRTENVS